MTPIILRDEIFSIGHQVLSAYMAQLLHLNDSNQITKAVAGGVPDGVIAALLTHPFDTTSTIMKSDSKKSTMIKTINNLYKNGDLRLSYKGLIARLTRVCLAIPLLTYITGILENELKNL